MMTSASAALIQEGMSVPTSEGAGLTSGQAVAIGACVGVVSVLLSQRALAGVDDVSLGIMEGVDVRKALLIVVVMTMHSFSEGIGIGVSFGGSSPPQVRRKQDQDQPQKGQIEYQCFLHGFNVFGFNVAARIG